jgi:hypothetical protein
MVGDIITPEPQREGIYTFLDCKYCKEDPSWRPDYLCKSTKSDIYLSCCRNRFEGKCPNGFASDGNIVGGNK